MGTKEVMVLAPIMIFLYDHAFIAGSFAEAWRQKRKRLYTGLTVTPGIFIALAIFIGSHDGDDRLRHRGSLVAARASAATGHRALSRPDAFWPHPLVFDYGVFKAQGVMDGVLPSALIIVAIITATLIGFIRNAWLWSYAAIWFFAIHAPTSSILPSARQTMSEHRVYLPLAASADADSHRALLPLPQTKMGNDSRRYRGGHRPLHDALNRNEDYESEYALYSGALAVQPDNAYAQFGVGTLLLAQGRAQEALEHIETPCA